MTLKDFSREVLKFKKILIFCHTKPDGDTLGSGMALRLSLIRKGIDCNIVCDSDIPEKYSFFISPNTINTYAENNYDAHISVDCSDYLRLGSLSDLYKSNKNTFNIDHHISNNYFAKYNFVEDRAATCEIIFDLINIIGVFIDTEIANFLLLGISTDTGNFVHQNVTANTMQIASKLIERGANLNKIYYEMFKNQKRARAELYARTISKIRFFENDKIALIIVTQKNIEECNAKSDMTEGFIDFPLSIEGVEVAVCLLEDKDEQFKISFRSKGTVNVNEIAGVFGGGGHILASGCKIYGALEEVIDKLVYAIKVRM